MELQLAHDISTICIYPLYAWLELCLHIYSFLLCWYCLHAEIINFTERLRGKCYEQMDEHKWEENSQNTGNAVAWIDIRKFKLWTDGGLQVDMDEKGVVTRLRAGCFTVFPHILPCHSIFMIMVRRREIKEKTSVGNKWWQRQWTGSVEMNELIDLNLLTLSLNLLNAWYPFDANLCYNSCFKILIVLFSFKIGFGQVWFVFLFVVIIISSMF